jgi:hypothetical protein
MGCAGAGGGVAMGWETPGVAVMVAAAMGVPVAATVGVGVTVTVGVTVAVTVCSKPTTVALVQSPTTLLAASRPALHALLVNSPAWAIVVDTESCVEAPGASPLSSSHITYPVAPSTAPWFEALTKFSPSCSADPTWISVNGSVPVFVTV